MILAFIIVAFVLALCFYLFATKTEKGREYWNAGWQLYIKTRGNLPQAWREIRAMQTGAVSIDALLLIFVLVVVIYQLIPQISSQNVAVQASSNVSTMGKWAAGLGEWLFPLLGIMAIVFMFMKGRGGKRGKGT